MTMLTTDDFLRMIRLLEAYQSVVEQLSGMIDQLSVMADASLCQRCHVRQRDGYKYCDGCKKLARRDQLIASFHRRQAGLPVAV